MPEGDSLRPLKLTVVGDGTVGKTCLLIAYTANSFPTEHVPTVFDNFAKNVTVDGVEFSLVLWDTAGQEEYEKLRPLAYPKTDCFIICYAVDNKASFENVEVKWMPELRFNCPKANFILVATKSDLRGQISQPITEQEGKKLKQRIKANAFIQCSAKTMDGIEDVFNESVRSVMKQKNHRGKKICPLL